MIAGDLIVRETSNQHKMVKFTLAVQDEYKHKGHEKKAFSNFDCTAFGKTAEIICNCCQGGSRIVVDGKLARTTYLDREHGGKTSGVVINVKYVYFVGYPKVQRRMIDYAPVDENEFREIDCGDYEIPVDDLAFENGGVKKFMRSIEEDPNMLGGFSNGEGWHPVED